MSDAGHGGGDGRFRLLQMAVVGLVVVVLGGCGTSVASVRRDPGVGNQTTTEASTESTTAPTTTTSDEALIEQHLAAMFTESGGESEELATCIAREFVRRSGGIDGLANLGIHADSTPTQLGEAFDQMLMDRVLTDRTEPFDRSVDALFACGGDKEIRAEALAQTKKNGNSLAASECFADRVVGDRYLRLVFIIGQQNGTDQDPRVKEKFADPLIASVDDAAVACGVLSWGGS